MKDHYSISFYQIAPLGQITLFLIVLSFQQVRSEFGKYGLALAFTLNTNANACHGEVFGSGEYRNNSWKTYGKTY